MPTTTEPVAWQLAPTTTTKKNQPTKTTHLPQPPRPRPPDYHHSIEEEVADEIETQRERERIGRRDDRWKCSCDSQGCCSLIYCSVCFSSLSLVSCCPELSPKTIMSFQDKKEKKKGRKKFLVQIHLTTNWKKKTTTSQQVEWRHWLTNPLRETPHGQSGERS